MAKLTTEKMIYLLYAIAYSKGDSVTKGNVKSHLPSEWKDEAEEIYEFLQARKLIDLVSKGRISVTEIGEITLVESLATTTYKFDSIKGAKVLNALLKCIAKATQLKISSEEMPFEQFQARFKALYFEERKKQSLGGVVAIRKQELIKRFMEKNLISQYQFEQYFEALQTEGEITVTEGREDKLIEWVE